MSAHSVFVLDTESKPLTPTTPSKARKLMRGKQAEPCWNKFGQFGIRMLVQTRKETPKCVLGVDFGTKFEGYAVVVGKENNLAVMWKLPDKEKIVSKLEERKSLRKARIYRNCRRRECRYDNRERKGFIAPSQMVIIQSRMKCLTEFFKCYPIEVVALEDVKFNHGDKRLGKNFSTIEDGKKRIYNFIREKRNLELFTGKNTGEFRKKFNYKKSKNKSSETFNSHCSDALALAVSTYIKEHIETNNFIIVDDNYRFYRRKLHYTQFEKIGIRKKFAIGNYKGIRKGTICNFGQVCGGVKDKTIRCYGFDNKRIAKPLNKIMWLSHRFKVKGVL